LSIYIQIATIEDYEITNTVISAFENADNPKNIFIGIAATVSNDFFDKIVAPLGLIDNVQVKKFNPKTDRGLGKGRVNSRFAYADQDYILQIDAHTLFQGGWDTYILRVFELALEETENNKTLVTTYLGKYKIEGGRHEVIDNWTGYSFWPDRDVAAGVSLRACAPKPIKEFPDWAIGDKRKRFYPSNIVAGNFTLGNKEWAKFHGWSGRETFWEEEILPAITLLDNGFSLVFPNLPMPITHRYWEEDLERQVMDNIFDSVDDIFSLTNQYLSEFIEGNVDACEKYRKYSGYEIATNTVDRNNVVPKRYGFQGGAL
jgi:hypothetical protein